MGVDAKRAVALVGSALALGIAADVLFEGRPLGLNVFVFVACFALPRLPGSSVRAAPRFIRGGVGWLRRC
jgi:cell shape-determining protein MreD